LFTAGDLAGKLQASVSLERAAKEECHQIRAKLADLEGHSSTIKHELDVTKMQLNQVKAEKELTESELKA